jgi:hypothetical protein
MLLEGSCHCGDVRFRVESNHPYPFNLCYCSICRKTAGAGGYAVNISASFDSLVIDGAENIRTYNAKMSDAETGAENVSPAGRSFCRTCGSALWLWDPRWPDLLHPHASVIDTELPVPPERTHLMLNSKKAWVAQAVAPNDREFDAYPDESIAEWHERLKL